MAQRYASSSSDYSGPWDPDSAFCTGLGFEGEGKIVELRFHTVTAKDRVERYIAIVLDLKELYRVELNKYGVEVALDTKKEPASPRLLPFDQLPTAFAKSLTLLSPSLVAKLHPGSPGRFEFWSSAATDARHLNVGDEIHFKTAGDSFFLKRFFHTSMGDFKHLEGGQVMSQISKVSDQLGIKTALPQDEMDGCASDEWSD